MMPIHAADHAYLSFEQTTLPVAIEHGVGVQAIKIFGKAFLRNGTFDPSNHRTLNTPS